MFLRLADLYTGRDQTGFSSNEMEALSAVTCADTKPTMTLERVRVLAKELDAQAPALGAFTAWGTVGCTWWKAPADGPPGPEGRGDQQHCGGRPGPPHPPRLPLRPPRSRLPARA